MKQDDCFVELFKLQKMFENSFHITGSSETNSIENVYNNDSVSLTIAFKPTDPDFDTSVFSTPEGIRIQLKLHRTYTQKSLDSSTDPPQDRKSTTSNADSDHFTHPHDSENAETYYSIEDMDDITVGDPKLSDVFRKSIKKVLFDFITRNQKLRKYIIYESLKFLDKNLVTIYNISNSLKTKSGDNPVNNQPTQSSPQKKQVDNKSESPNHSCSSKSNDLPEKTEKVELPWSLEEQKCLEDGLVRYKGTADPVERWVLISKLVKTRSPAECRKRFIRCREVLVKKNKPPEPPKQEPPSYSLDKTGPLSFTGLEMTKLSLGMIGTFSMDVVCLRCAHRLEVTLADLGEKTIVYSRSCEKCAMSIRCEFTPSLFFPSQLTFGRLSMLNLDFIDINHAEFKLTCEDCETQSKIREVKIGDKKSFICRGCFNKFLFAFDGVQFGEQAAPALETVVKKVIKYETKKTPQPKGIKVGTPLPANGTCKHYKKSFRWFRFPCCGRLFPCDICHDDVSDHKCGHANFIVCGHCSTQQPSSNKVCKSCTKTYTASSSSHWEGGKGCRDATKLSRKDSKKYKLISKNNTKK
ncbi:hypothetical protein MACK_000874 [Theileria orientalis]|uniref:CHY-type domain-containing protein n=1 Tax=Theileria orientalis TaxID=68886 RepID=A0A976MAE3_THEOR|nr:hypothetical protein MACK_000874 [Theileria orientalis]